VTADFSGVDGSGPNVYTYTFGPEVHAHLPLLKPFAHAVAPGWLGAAAARAGLT